MTAEEKILQKIYASVLGTAAILLVQKVVTKVWEAATESASPDPNDLDTPLTQVLIWALYSGVGIGMTRLTMSRYMQRRWFSNTGCRSPGRLRNKMNL